MPGWKILCDFDGTIVASDVTDYLLERFASEGWRKLERDWEQGLIGARECMQSQVALIEATPAALDEAIAAMVVDPGFPGFVVLARSLDIPLTIVSDGLDRVIQDVLRRANLPDIETMSSRLEFHAGRWRLDFPYAGNDGCLSAACTCKCAIARRDPRRTLVVGDGRSDFCVADMADFVFAKHNLLSYCEATQIPHAPFADFTEAQTLLEELVARTAVVETAGQVANANG
ncbi:MAG TPA: HAD-IB family phosphatase [Alphaproteobacteria bacterium]|nr:HAD-IB family phosphatase [Alphaproteobacteria bacterium]